MDSLDKPYRPEDISNTNVNKVTFIYPLSVFKFHQFENIWHCSRFAGLNYVGKSSVSVQLNFERGTESLKPILTVLYLVLKR